jgi:DNA-binding Lrp family transcriptional regulator
LILYHLQKETLEGIPFGSISDRLGYSLKTVSLIATELKDLDICQHIQLDSKTKSLEFKSKDKRQLWNNVLPYLSSPIHKVVYTYPEDVENIERYSCYDNALAHYTDIIDSSQRCYAVDKRSISVNSIGIKSDLNFIGAVRLELWKYNPSILAEDGIIDPLSMYLCYKDDDNERVLGEINKLVDKIL